MKTSILVISVLCVAFSITPQEVKRTSIDRRALPLGNSHISSEPRVGAIYSCNSRFNGQGAFRVGDWIREAEAVFDLTSKREVDGANLWDDASILIYEDSGQRYIKSNGLPTNHGTGNFPIHFSDDAYSYDRNPYRIAEQSISYVVPTRPTYSEIPYCLNLGAIGIALNGVAIYHGLDAEGRDALAYELHDTCNGHPDRSGEYHYHSGSRCVKDKETNGHSALFGYALDGFGIFGQRSGGEYMTNSHLDECHGHTHTIPWDGFLTILYHYHITDEFPYTLGCFRGRPLRVSSELQRNATPQKSQDACRGKLLYASCFINHRGNAILGTCQRWQRRVVCVPIDRKKQ